VRFHDAIGSRLGLQEQLCRTNPLQIQGESFGVAQSRLAEIELPTDLGYDQPHFTSCVEPIAVHALVDGEVIGVEREPAGVRHNRPVELERDAAEPWAATRRTSPVAVNPIPAAE
jgi:hypothetical protein